MNSFCISGWPLQDQGPPAHTDRVRDGSAVHDSGATLCLAFAALCVNCCHNNTNRAKTKRATNCQHDSNSSSSNRDNKQLAAIVVVAADVAAFAVYCLLGVIFIGAYYLHIPARSGVGAGTLHIVVVAAVVTVAVAAAVVDFIMSLHHRHRQQPLFIAIRHAHCVEIST